MNKVAGANVAGLTAILLWSLLAILPLMAGDVPPLLLLGTACSFACAFLFVVWCIRYGNIRTPLSYITRKYFLINAGFLFAAEVTLIVAMQAGDPMAAYLALDIWPVFTLIFTAIILKQRLYMRHYIAAVLGVVGVCLLVLPDAAGVETVTLEQTMAAIFFGLCNAVIWSLYSVLNNKFQDIPADCVALPLTFCVASALILHALVEPSYPLHQLTTEQWFAIIMLGVLPWGMAYALWGYAMRFGDIRMLSIYGYAMPLLGVAWLLAFGYAALTLPIIAATVLILASAIMGSYKTQTEVS
ncbi:MAG: DMT family transporter [Proteobacteria bacterium]|nr:DMT family transporter [Pseudomonadota bacterium]